MRALGSIIDTSRYVLLDFDGPVCSIFAGRAAAGVAAELRRLIIARTGDLPPAICRHDDPLMILRAAEEMSAGLARELNADLRSAEIDAAATAQPTPGAAELLHACQGTGRPVAIVSNNSTEAVAAYLTRVGLAYLVAHVEGRDPTSPRLMKPHPHLLLRALDTLRAEPDASILIGDSTTDVDAAHAAGVAAVGYANKPGKAHRLAEAGAAVTVAHLDEITRDVLMKSSVA